MSINKLEYHEDGRGTDDETLILIGRSMTVVWVKIVSSWVVYLLYGWSLILPVVTENS